MVRAKFRVANIDGSAPFASKDAATITLVPVCSGSPENKEFFKWTPSGIIQLQCCNPAATEQFKVNGEYYVDFTEAK